MQKSIAKISLEIDTALDRQDEGALQRAISEIESLDKSQASASELASLDFCAANAHSGLRDILEKPSETMWVSLGFEREIGHLRQALNHLSGVTTRDLRTDLRPRIETNLGNVLDQVGRFVEAIEHWDRALAEHSRFAMAWGSRGKALFWYSRYVVNVDQQAYLLRESYRSYLAASKFGAEPHARDEIQYWVNHLNKIANWERLDIQILGFQGKASKREQAYRKWCIEKRLVLNPINDATILVAGLLDTLTLPSIRVVNGAATAALPSVYSIFNQLKQEYTAARYVVFEAMEEKNRKGLHFADKGVVLYDALDYRCYRLWIEKLKMAFLSAHAILDKMAYLINDYWKLSLDTRAISFGSIWYCDGNVQKGLSPRFQASTNRPLQGLYWLSRDFHFRPTSQQSVLPEAKVIHEIRNHIAHKYLRVHDHWIYSAANERMRGGTKTEYPVTDSELEDHTFTLFKLVRSALIYLSSAVLHEEIDSKPSDDELFVPMPITTVSERNRP